MDKERIVSSTQEQASSAWVGWLNQIRLNELFEKLSTQNGNLAEVMASMDDAMKSINNLIITNRGGGRGIQRKPDWKTPKAIYMAAQMYASGSTITVRWI